MTPKDLLFAESSDLLEQQFFDFWTNMWPADVATEMWLTFLMECQVTPSGNLISHHCSCIFEPSGMANKASCLMSGLRLKKIPDSNKPSHNHNKCKTLKPFLISLQWWNWFWNKHQMLMSVQNDHSFGFISEKCPNVFIFIKKIRPSWSPTAY